MALASSVVVLALVFVEQAGALEAQDRRHHQTHQQATKRERSRAARVRHRARAQRKASRYAVSYVCSMHTDIREKSRGTCPKCLMDLVAESRGQRSHQSAPRQVMRREDSQ
jgi:hypothetical protein